MTVVVLTTGTSWTVPTDWNNSANTIACLGGGAGGRAVALVCCVETAGAGGGGGGFSQTSNVALSIGASIPIAIGGGGGAGGNGGDTSFNSGAIVGKGAIGSAGGVSGTGGLKTTGGSGHAGGTGQINGNGGGGGGGAAGADGNGNPGGAVSVQTGGTGGSGDAGSGGAGGSARNNGSAGNNLGGGVGSGGGGGGGSGSLFNTVNAGSGGNYGAGGGGAAFNILCCSETSGTAGSGIQGVIVITYTPSPPAISSISPASGPLGGGTVVAITGSFFISISAVKFGTVNAVSFTVNSSTSITATAPAGGRNAVDITVTGVNGTSATSGSDQYSFIGPEFAAFALSGLRHRQSVMSDGFIFVPAPPVQTPSILTYYPPFDPAPRPHNFARDSITFTTNFGVISQPTTFSFTPFGPATHSRNFARDWIAFSGSIVAETFPPVGFDFTPFDLGRHAPNFGRDWITQFGDIKVDTFPLDPVDFLDFSPGKTARFFGNRQPPPWTTYYLNTQFFPKRDTHDGLPRRHRHPPVYSDDYYDRLRKRREREQPAPAVERVPNLLIPLNRLIMPVAMPTLINAPPFRPVPSLHLNPPPFRMATPEEIEADDAMIIKMLLEE